MRTTSEDDLNRNQSIDRLTSELAQSAAKMEAFFHRVENNIMDVLKSQTQAQSINTLPLAPNIEADINANGYRYGYILFKPSSAISSLPVLISYGSRSFMFTLQPGLNRVYDSTLGNAKILNSTSDNVNVELILTRLPLQFDNLAHYGSLINLFQAELMGRLAPLPSPGEVLLVGPSANISMAPGVNYWTPTFNGLGNRMTGYFMDATLSSTAMLSSVLQAVSSLLGTTQTMYLAGNTAQSSNVSALANSSAFLTDKYNVSFNATSTNTTDAILNGASLGIG